MDITFDRKTIGTCLQQRFILPTYQRDYRWEVKHLQELLTDIQEEFLESYKPNHGRSDVGDYAPYFLGTIITTAATSGARAIVDGQQRLTTLTVILTYFYRFSKAHPDQKISNIEALLRRQVFGSDQFNIDFDEDRKKLFETLLNNISSDNNLDEIVDSIPGMTESTREIYRIFNEVDNFLLEDIKLNLIPNFVDYLIERVYLFEIGVPSEQDGHKVFVTMNDRGLKLAPIDLLKGYLLSNISSTEFNTRANEKWSSCIKDLRNIGRDEDSAFFKTWLRAQYAHSIRGKAKGASPGDFEVVGDAYHRWVVDNDNLLGLSNSDDFYNMVTGQIPFFVDNYKRIKVAENSLTPEFPHVYYNGARNITLQYMAILASIDYNDNASIVEKKIKIVSYYVDYFSSMRIISGKDNNYDNIRDQIFNLSVRIRRKSVPDLVLTIREEMRSLEESFSDLERFGYYTIKRQDLLHLLARIASYLEDGIDQTNKVGFDGYIDRSKGNKTFDIEHIVPDLFLAKIDADSIENNNRAVLIDSFVWRNELGALTLLPRGRNRSLKAMPYQEKLQRYATENILAQTLSAAFYQNNPNVNEFIVREGVPLAPIDQFDKAAVEARLAIYKAICQKIWSVGVLEALAG